MEIVVVGAGLAGLTFAAALRRLGGIDVQIVDERLELGGGAAITLAPHALAALDHVGLGDAVRSIGAPADAGSVRRADGRAIHDLDAERTVRLLGEPVRVVDRGELQRLLAHEADPARLRLGAAATGLRQLSPGRVGVDLAGGEVLQASAVVGADGFRSTVARALDPSVRARHAGYTAWRGVAETTTQARHHGVVWGERWEAGIAAMTRGRTYWFTTLAVPAGHAEDPSHWATVRRRLLALGEPWERLLSTSDIQEEPIALMDRSGPRRWSSGDIAVIGDAAHPMQPALGQGGAQAIIDAVLLAAVLTRPGARPAEVFGRFERRRRLPVGAIVRASRTAGRSLHGARPTDRVARAAAERMPSVLFEQVLRRIASRDAWPRLGA